MQEYKFKIEGIIKCEDNVIENLLKICSVNLPFESAETIEDFKVNNIEIEKAEEGIHHNYFRTIK